MRALKVLKGFLYDDSGHGSQKNLGIGSSRRVGLGGGIVVKDAETGQEVDMTVDQWDADHKVVRRRRPKSFKRRGTSSRTSR